MSLIGAITSMASPVQKLVTSFSPLPATPPPPPAPNTAALAAEALKKDLAALLKLLAEGNMAEAKVAVAQLAGDLKAQKAQDSKSGGNSTSGSAVNSSSPASAANSPGSPSSALDTLVGSLSASLAKGGTSTALQDLTDYLLKTGEASGTLLKTAA